MNRRTFESCTRGVLSFLHIYLCLCIYVYLCVCVFLSYVAFRASCIYVYVRAQSLYIITLFRFFFISPHARFSKTCKGKFSDLPNLCILTERRTTTTTTTTGKSLHCHAMQDTQRRHRKKNEMIFSSFFLSRRNFSSFPLALSFRTYAMMQHAARETIYSTWRIKIESTRAINKSNNELGIPGGHVRKSCKIVSPNNRCCYSKKCCDARPGAMHLSLSLATDSRCTI